MNVPYFPILTLNSAIAKEEVSRLTPKMLASGAWQNVTFKPYSLKTKPRRIYAGRYNPYRQFLDHIRIKLIGLGFQEMKGPLIEQEFWNFDALYAPQDHSAREDSDIFYIVVIDVCDIFHDSPSKV